MTQRILIIEDEEALINALSEKLTGEGYEVLKERDGDSGLTTALREHPDLILLDIVMPKTDGLEMARSLRTDGWGKEAKIILLTNVGGIDKVQEAMEIGIYEYFMKTDIELEQVVERVQSMIGLPNEA